MKVISNTKLVNRNKKIGQYSTISSLLVLGIGLFMSFKPEYYTYSVIALILGFILSQIGIFFGSRWGRSPRPDEIITQKLKGLGEKYSIYHFITAVPHLILGPAGIWVIIPFYQGGTIVYDEEKSRWKQKKANLYLRIFAQENLGRPELEIKSYREDFEKFLKKNFPDTTFPPINVALVFTNPKAEIDAQNAPIPTLPAEKLKDYLRKVAKESPVADEPIKLLQSSLPKEDL
jgi:hypothetical protein